MSNDRPSKPMQRYSRFSRPSYEDILPPTPPEDPSLTEIAMRALNGHHEPRRTTGAKDFGRLDHQHQSWDQPPPPEPSAFWEDEAQAANNPPRRRSTEVRSDPASAMREKSAPPESELQPLPRHPRPEPAPTLRDRLAERTAAGARGLLRRAKGDREGTAVKTKKPRREPPQPEPGKERRSSAVAKALKIARTKAVPALARSALWVAHNLRRREIRKRYNRALVFGHTRIADRKLERLFFVTTRKAELINPAVDRGIHYDGPVPAKVFDWLMALMPDDLRRYAFIDIRAGRGRTTLLAAKRKFNRIIAYEYDAETFDDLQMNVAQFPRSQMTCRNVDCHRGDIDGISLPDQPCIIYFSGAWREQMLPGVMNYVRDTYRQSPRPIFVILENTDEAAALPDDNIFTPIEPPLAERLKLRLLSPMDFKLYRSLI